MSDEISDAEEFVNASNNFKAPSASIGHRAQRDLLRATLDDMHDDDKKPGQPTQYALHADGYTATTSTVAKLPAGCYDIKADNNCVYVTPVLPPSGLLLELPEMRSEEVIKVVESFWENEDNYKKGNEFVIGGAIYKAGTLIYGPGGSGKSSTIKLVSKKLIERGGIVFYGSTSPVIVSTFLQDFAKIEHDRKCIVILEDLDTLIENYGESAYLEMLDSAKTINNAFFIATTNYPEKLDPRIYNRPGRFSHVIKIGLPPKATRRAYLKAILKNHRDVEYMVEHSENFTIDHLSSLVNSVYREGKALEHEIKRLRILFKVPTVEDKSNGFGLSTEVEE